MIAHEITIIDYGVGNLLSVRRGFEHCGAKVHITSDKNEILASNKVVLPGVGAFSNAMQALKDLGLVETIQSLVENGTPLLGICLGMQLLFDESEEFGPTAGLGIIPGKVVALPSLTKSGSLHKIPHIGWSGIYASGMSKQWENKLLNDVECGSPVYFVHSFMAQPNDPLNLIAECIYGGHRIPAVIAKDNVVGCQFHPEKSGSIGLKILQRFCGD